MNTNTSMTTAARILRFVDEHPNDELITRRMLVPFGPDGAVDNVIFRLIHISGRLVRVGQGVYRKRERAAPVSTLEVATVKARAFGRDLIRSAQQAAFDLGLCENPGGSMVFQTNGRSSSFKVGDEEVMLRGTSPRKMALGDSRVGQAIRALWHLGKDAINEHVIGHATRSFSIEERATMGSLGASMPYWLRAYCYAWFLIPTVEQASGSYVRNEKRDRGLREAPVEYKTATVIPFQANLVCAAIV